MSNPSDPEGIVADILLSEPLVVRYLAVKRDVGLALKTLGRYAWYLEALAREYPKLPLDPELLQRFIKCHGGKAADSLKTAFRTIHTFYRWLVKQQALDVTLDPFLRMESPKGKTPVPRILSLQQMRRLVEVSNPPFNRALILTLLDTACRIGDLAGRNKDHLSGGGRWKSSAKLVGGWFH